MTSPSYLVIHLAVPPEDSDRVTGRLYDLGCLGLEEREESGFVLLKTYFEDPGRHDLFLKNLQTILPCVAIRQVTSIGLGDPAFRPATYEPFPLGPFVIVPPPDLGEPPSELGSAGSEIGEENGKPRIVIRPGPAFGTGRHETTRLVSRALVLHSGGSRTLLDVGTGSGILAILGRKLGIPKVTAVEISAEALQNASENFRLNGCEDIVLVDDIAKAGGGFDLILANLLTPTILHLKPILTERLNPGGLLILSGVTVLEADELEEAFRDYRRIERNDTDEWACFTFQKP